MVNIKTLGVDIEHLEEELIEQKKTERAQFKPMPYVVLLLIVLYAVDLQIFNSQLMSFKFDNSGSFALEIILLIVLSLVLMFIYSLLSVILFTRKQNKKRKPFFDEHHAIIDQYKNADGDALFKAYRAIKHKPITTYEKYMWGVTMSTSLCKMGETKAAIKLLNKLDVIAVNPEMQALLKAKKIDIENGICVTKEVASIDIND